MRINRTTRTVALSLAALTLVAMMTTGCPIFGIHPTQTDVERMANRVDAAAAAAIAYYPDLEPTFAPIRQLAAEALADGVINTDDLVPALRAARDVYIARLIDDDELDEDTLDERIRQAKAIEALLEALVT